MQDVTPWPGSFDVSEPVARVIVDGHEVDVESVTVTSELDSAMPERVAAGGGGVVAATGDATVFRDIPVTSGGLNPWGDAAALVDASEVVVEAGYRDHATGDVGCVRQITGQVEALSGGALRHDVGLDFVDHTRRLDREITMEPLLRDYPPLEYWGPKRGAGLSPMYVTDRVLRYCGFYATPPTSSGAVVSAPMMGSAVPERGTLVSAWAETDPGLDAVFEPVGWGMGLSNGAVTYRPALGWRGHGRLTSTLHFSFHLSLADGPLSGNTRVEARWGSSGNAVWVVCDDNSTVTVRYVTAGIQTVVARMPAGDVAASEAFTVLVDPSGEAKIYASNGATVSGSATLPPQVSSQDLSEVAVATTHFAHTLGGVQVAFSQDRNHQYQRTAHLDPPAHYHSLQAFPAQLGVNCLNLLKAQAEAELAAMWVDEYGHFRWRNRHRLRGASPVGTLTSQQHLFDISWSLPIRSVYSRVELKHEVPTVTLRRVPSITVSDSRGSTLSDGDDDARFFEPPANQDWHHVSAPRWLGGSYSRGDLIRGVGSFHGGVVVDDDGDERLSYSTNLTQSWSQINVQRWLLSSSAQNLEPDEFIEQRFPDSPELYGKFAEDDLPIIRAMGVTEWGEDAKAGETLGPAHAPVFSHTVGPWIQNSTELQSLADWLADELTNPAVILRDVPIVPDPRIQLGDIFWLDDDSAYDVRLKVLVMGKKLEYRASQSGHQMSQTITCRILEVSRTRITYDELAYAWEDRDYASLESAWSDSDYQGLADNPLNRSEP